MVFFELHLRNLKISQTYNLFISKTCFLTARPLLFNAFIVFLCSPIKAQAKTHWRFSIFILYCLASFCVPIHCCQGSSCSLEVDIETKRSVPNPQMNLNISALPPETISHKIIEPLLYCHSFLNLTNCT